MILNNEMPRLGMGTFRLKGNVAYESVKTALEVGYRHIDTAQIYGNEAEVGQAILDSGIDRAELFVTTKVWNSNLNKASFLPSVKESLTKLKMPFVDLLLIHWPAPENGEPMAEYLGELIKAQENGLARHIGLSNFTTRLLQEAQNTLPAKQIYTNQVEVHPYLQNRILREYCAAKGISVTGYMPFAVGKVLQDDTIVKIAGQHARTPAEVIVAWELAKGLSTIPSSTKRENLQTNLNGLSLTLSHEDIQAIDNLDRNDRQAAPDCSPEWD